MILAFPQTKADSVDCKSPTLLTRLVVRAVKFRGTNKFGSSNTETCGCGNGSRRKRPKKARFLKQFNDFGLKGKVAVLSNTTRTDDS